MPSLREEREPNNRTVLELQMLDLFPAGVLSILKLHFKDRFESLPQMSRLALAITRGPTVPSLATGCACWISFCRGLTIGSS